MPTIHKTKAGADTEIWGYPVGALGSHKLGTLRPAGKGTGFEASREMKSGFEIKTFLSQKVAEHWIIPADIWGPLQ